MISNSSFYGCSGLEGSLIIPNYITIIENYSFYNCSGYKDDLILSSSLKKIGENAFGLTKFSNVLYEGENEPECNDDIGFSNKQIIHVIDNYKNDFFCGYEIEYINGPTSETTATEEPENIDKTKLSKGVIAVIAISCIIVFVIVIIFIVFIYRRKLKQPNINPKTLLDVTD